MYIYIYISNLSVVYQEIFHAKSSSFDPWWDSPNAINQKWGLPSGEDWFRPWQILDAMQLEKRRTIFTHVKYVKWNVHKNLKYLMIKKQTYHGIDSLLY